MSARVDKDAVRSAFLSGGCLARVILRADGWTVRAGRTATGIWCSAIPSRPWQQTQFWFLSLEQCQTLTYKSFIGKVWSMIQKPSRPDPAALLRAPLPDENFRSRWPVLLEYLESVRYADGSPRDTSTLTLFVDAGTLKASLNDRQEGRSLWAASDTLSGLLDTIESMLCGESVPWRWKEPDGTTTRKKRGP